MHQPDWPSLIIGIAFGALAGVAVSLISAIILEELKKPHLLIESIALNPMKYLVTTTARPGKNFDIRVAEDSLPADLSSLPPIRSLNLCWYNVFVQNTRPKGPIASRLDRNIAWAATAGIAIRQFTPGQISPTPGFACSFSGRWGSTEQPGIPPTDVGIRRGRQVNIQPEATEGLNLLLKYEQEDNAWVFSNESYTYADESPGLWRKPDWRIPPNSHLCIRLELCSTGKTFTYHLHAKNFGVSPESLDLHLWHQCPDCSGTTLPNISG